MTMKTLVILNHPLTAEQTTELGGTIVNLTPAQKALWANIPAIGDAQAVRDHLAEIIMEIQQVNQVVCQGESTAFAQIVRICDAWDIPVLVACSMRESVETVQSDGSTVKTNVFRHVQFRRV